MVCKLCPARKHCWDKGTCESCEYGKAFNALERKIGRLKKKNAELTDLNAKLRADVAELEDKINTIKNPNF